MRNIQQRMKENLTAVEDTITSGFYLQLNSEATHRLFRC